LGVGDSGYFFDPGGSLWEVAWNPSVVVGGDKPIRIPD
jgi:hypothetical protein